MGCGSAFSVTLAATMLLGETDALGKSFFQILSNFFLFYRYLLVFSYLNSIKIQTFQKTFQRFVRLGDERFEIIAASAAGAEHVGLSAGPFHQQRLPAVRAGKRRLRLTSGKISHNIPFFSPQFPFFALLCQAGGLSCAPFSLPNASPSVIFPSYTYVRRDFPSFLLHCRARRYRRRHDRTDGRGRGC